MKKKNAVKPVMFLCLFAMLIYMFSCTVPSQAAGSELLTGGELVEGSRAESYPAWNATTVYLAKHRVVHNKIIWEAKWWTKGAEPKDGVSVWKKIGPATGNGGGPIITKPVVLYELNEPGQVRVQIYKDKETAATYSGRIILNNPNTSYVWNETLFAIHSVQFETTSTITEVKSGNGTVFCNQANGVTEITLGWQSVINQGGKVEVSYTASKGGAQVLPKNFKINYVRGDKARMYPAYASLPTSFVKGSASYSAGNLISNSSDYYQSTAAPGTGQFIVYNPDHATQVRIGQTVVDKYKVNTVANVRIWMPSKFMAMGVATVYEYFRINPNYMVALGTKENFSAGIVPPESGETRNPIVVDGKKYYWPIVLGHVDGPFQQEKGNFGDAKQYFVDYLGEQARHTDFTQIMNRHDPKWISAAMSSGISISVTRETLAAIKDAKYFDFVDNATDQWAEFAIVTYAYNRGASMFLTKKLFTSKRQLALSTTDIPSAFDMGGFGSHVPTVKAIVQHMNADTTDIYDEKITWADMEAYFTQLRKFYAKGVPTDAEWNAMKSDVRKAYNTLSAHWGGTHVSFRYDFLTLLRVAKAHLPEINPRPAGGQWYYIIKNAQP